MDASRSKILCLVNSLVIWNTLSILTDFVQVFEEYKEYILVQFFLASTVENKETFLKACSKPDSQMLNHPFPIDYNTFNGET